MRVEGNATGFINWRLRGRIGLAPIDADIESRYVLNVLTGRIEQHMCASSQIPAAAVVPIMGLESLRLVGSGSCWLCDQGRNEVVRVRVTPFPWNRAPLI